jgi:hypothetical protein
VLWTTVDDGMANKNWQRVRLRSFRNLKLLALMAHSDDFDLHMVESVGRVAYEVSRRLLTPLKPRHQLV